jgi:sugar lactone lactonase YvrE
MKRKLLKLLILTMLASLVLSCGFTADAKEPYASYYLGDNGAYSIPAPYEVVTVIDFKTTEEGRLASPEDIFIDDNDVIYVADTANDRIVIINPMDENGNYTLKNIIKGDATYASGDMSGLKTPKGIYVDADGTILVADTGNNRLVEFTKYGYFKYSYAPPSSSILSSEFNYMPLKVTKDTRGYIYVANSSDSNGILMLDGDGTFRQYFGANKVSLTFWESVARLLWDREDRLGTVVTLPYSFNNIYASSDGYIYATTTTATPPQVRKINAGGSDVVYSGYDFRDMYISTSYGASTAQNFCDVSVDNLNNMLIVDQQYGRIYEYDQNGINLFAFSTNGTGYGQLSLPAGLEVDSQGRVYVLNKGSGTITVFQTTEFADQIHAANEMYARGKYQDAFPLWQTVLDRDSYYNLALKNMGTIHMREEEYKEAIEYFYEAEDAALASQAYKEIRAEFLRQNFPIIASVLVGVVVLWIVWISIKQARRRKYGPPPEKKNFLTPVKDFWGRIKNVLAHPIDSFEGIRYENKGSYADMIIIMVLWVIIAVASEYAVGFIYRGGTPREFIRPMQIILTALLPWLVVCTVNYGVTTIMYGEGRVRDVFIGGAYCHIPLVLFSLPLALLTNVLTNDEMSLYNLIHTLIYVWVGLLVYLCIKSIHGFHPVKAVIVTFITLVGVALVVLLFMIVYGLANQLFDFITQFGKELSYLV